jgi:rhodanese-related sulfurtransferase
MFDMQRLLFLFTKTILLTFSLCGQNNSSAANRQGHCQNAAFDHEVANWLSFNVPAIDVDSLRKVLPGTFILDAREPKEYAVSHIEGAVNCGFDHADLHSLDTLPKNQPILVYCSIGYRSEKIARKLRKKGFKNVSNLYGSIFEWVNRGYPVVDSDGQPTQKIHTYNKSWGKWVDNPGYERVY